MPPKLKRRLRAGQVRAIELERHRSVLADVGRGLGDNGFGDLEGTHDTRLVDGPELRARRIDSEQGDMGFQSWSMRVWLRSTLAVPASER
jgi:hypothetical protein